ncbi:efflux RND transporter periplasmic adaptor subunit [Candidatus Venteria ishoeyi]|uniref:Putative efflux pump membrane fusion protein n=1 Tax=Candidatus Venteria ishoeyi TaxID=1899563 RepID=A0A1H6FFK7_9GAMM|nr:efflux RND transporter periplasmic adaptor subunit [Candidatus Venteria ishoeyi]SEH08423.1 putative efflux pump membrane fusion protein [Candidatus Venteria ishoeyi]
MAQAVQLPALDLLTLHQYLHQLFADKKNSEAYILQVLQLLLGLSNAAGVLYGQRNGKQLERGPAILSKQALSWHPHMENQLLQQIEVACQQQQVQIHVLDAQVSAYIIATPVYTQDKKPEEGVALVVVPGEQRIEWFVTLLQLCTAYLNLPEQLPASPAEVSPDTSKPTDYSRRLIELLTHTLAAPDMSVAAKLLSNTLQQDFQAQRVLLGLVKGRHCRLHTISELSDIKRQADFVHACESLMDAVIAQKQALNSQNPEHRKTQPTLQRLLVLGAADTVLALPLAALPDNNASGALLILWKTNTNLPQENLEALAMPLGTTLATLKKAQPNWLQRQLHPLRKNPGQRLLLITIVLSLLALMWLPVSHKLSGNVLLEPMKHRFINAPFDGVLKQALHEPGDVIETETLLAQLDGREINWELSGLKAERSRAQKQKDVSTAARDAAKAQIAQLEIERIDAKMALLNYRLNNLEIISPINGLLISGDLKRIEGGTLSKGQTLFEIAPLDEMRVQMSLNAEDIAWAQVNMPLEVRLDAYPDQMWDTQVKKIRPRAEIRDAQAVFIIETDLLNSAGRLRPGMQGLGQIDAGQKALGWVLFHKAWEQVIKWLR